MALTQITEKGIKDGEIINADINASAAIAGSKIDPSFGNNAIISGGRLTIANVNPYITLTDTNNDSDFSIQGGGGTFVIKDDTNGADRLVVKSDGQVGIGTSSPDRTIHCHNSSNTTNVRAKFSNGTTGEGASDGFEIGINASDPAQAVLVNYENSPMAFFTNGSQRMTIDSSGVVRVGGTDSYNASDKLTLVGSGNTSLTIDSTSTTESSIFFADGATGTEAYRGYLQYKNADDALAIGTAATERMRLDSSGRLLIGTTTAGEGSSDNLTVADSSHCGITIRSGSSSGGNVFFTDATSGDQFQGYVQYNHSDNSLKFGTAKIERMRITNDGKVLIGTTSNGGSGGLSIFPLHDDGACTLVFDRANTSATSTVLAFENNNSGVGSITHGNSSTSYNTSSDYRLKENVTAISDGITRLKTLKPYRFNFKVDASTTVDGFLAHEVTAVPEAITGTKDETQDILYTEDDTIPSGKKIGDVKEVQPVYQGIDQSKLVPLLTAALQEAVGKIETLETKVAALEAV